MDNAQVTFDLGWLIAGVVVPVTMWLFKRLNDVGQALADYKLYAERQFASVGHLQDVESRLVDEIKGLRADIKDLTRSLNGFGRAPAGE
ncbi:MAG: hypothetical protein HQL35_10720 [Alphaproteobacteria bacterium]|nr:hypothetical protein [Alphaproteobacteria bacterium]